ncbi:MAG: hypothetical protein ABI653_08325 [Bacteroidota bacterium]
MKKLILSLILVIFVVQVFSQTPTPSAHSKDYYLKKHKNQNTIGWITFGVGMGLLIVGLRTEKGGFGGNIDGIAFQEYDNTLANTLATTGLVITCASVPFLISAHSNKKKAAAVTVGTQRIFLPQQNQIVFKPQPTFTLKIPLK